MAEETNHKPYRLGLALSGGGAKGFCAYRSIPDDGGMRAEAGYHSRYQCRILNGHLVCRWLFGGGDPRAFYRT